MQHVTKKTGGHSVSRSLAKPQNNVDERLQRFWGMPLDKTSLEMCEEHSLAVPPSRTDSVWRLSKNASRFSGQVHTHGKLTKFKADGLLLSDLKGNEIIRPGSKRFRSRADDLEILLSLVDRVIWGQARCVAANDGS